MLKSLLEKIKMELDKQYSGYSTLFNPGASAAQIQEYENLTGFEMPQDFKELYLLCNGQQRKEEYGVAFFFALPFLTIEESMEQWKFLNQVLPDSSMFDYRSHSLPVDCIREQAVNKGWIPISKDSGGNYIGIDLNPGEKGTVGQVINFGRDEDIKYVIAPGLEGFLAYMLQLIEQHRLSILVEEDEDADEEEDEDGNLLPLPLVCRFAIDKAVIWHFLDWLKVLDLPGKPILMETDKNYHSWLDQAPEEWQALIHANCNSGGMGFVHPAYLIKFSSGSLPIKELRYLPYLKNVREVVLSGAPLKDISELLSVPLIKTLFLSNTAVENLDALKSLKRLQQLSLYKLSVKDLSPLEDLPLTDLSLEHTPIDDLTSVSKIRTLQQLNISYTNVSSGETLIGLGNLRSLNIIGSKIKDLTFLGKLRSLQELEIDALEVDTYQPLAPLSTLTHVTCSFALFKYLKQEWTHPVRFSICGEMTDAEQEEWRVFHHES